MGKKIPLEQAFFSRTNDFLSIYLTRQRSRSPETVKAYRRALRTLFDYIADGRGMDPSNFAFTDCTFDFLLEFVQHLREKEGLSGSSVNQYMAGIRSYLKYVADSDFTLYQVYLAASKVAPQKVPKLQRPVIETDSLAQLLSLPPDTLKGNRDRVLLILLFDSAMRASELVRLKIEDVSVDISSPHIIVNGKGRKQRVVALNDRTAAHVRRYIENYHGPEPDPDTPLFYTRTHGVVSPMTVRNVERIVKKYADELRTVNPDLPDRVYPHMFRRTRATGLYRDGVPLELVSAVLGHSSTETTKIYAIPSVEQLRTAMEKGTVATSGPEKPVKKEWAGSIDAMRKQFGLA